MPCHVLEPRCHWGIASRMLGFLDPVSSLGMMLVGDRHRGLGAKTVHSHDWMLDAGGFLLAWAVLIST